MSIVFRPVLVTAPVGLPVEVSECKKHAVIEHAESDDLVAEYLSAATAEMDGFRGILGRAILTQTWQMQVPDWCTRFLLPVPDVSAVEITYFDEDGAEQSGPDVTLQAVATGTMVRIASNWSRPALEADSDGPVSVKFTCGFGAAVAVPSDIKVAIMQLAAHMFAEREGISIAEPVYDRLISKYRWSVI